MHASVVLFCYLKIKNKKIFQDYHQCQRVCLQIRTPDLGASCLQRLLVDDTRRQRVKKCKNRGMMNNLLTKLTHLSRMECPSLIKWTNSFTFEGWLGGIFFILLKC